MTPKEREIVLALTNYLRAKNDLDNARKGLKLSLESNELVDALAKIVAEAYNCHSVRTRTGSISFCDSLGDHYATRRDDARMFWKRNITG